MMDWIAHETLDQHIRVLMKRASDAFADAVKRRHKNVVDPFSSFVIASTLGIEEEKTLERFQLVESTLRGSSNALGEFHQAVLGSVKGWRNHDSGYDLECAGRRIIAEVKNKHNTMNAANRREVVNELRTALRQKKGDWVGYLVQIIPQKPIRQVREVAANLFEVDGASFYELVTGDANAIHDLFEYMLDAKMPNVEISRCCREIFRSSLPPRQGQN